MARLMIKWRSIRGNCQQSSDLSGSKHEAMGISPARRPNNRRPNNNRIKAHFFPNEGNPASKV
jgi:hypothetical protein